MDGVRLQSLVYRGYAIAAQRVSEVCEQYRPPASTTTAPLIVGNRVNTAATVYGGFAPKGTQFNFAVPATTKSPLYNALVDGRQTEIGDFFVAANGLVYFIAAMDHIVPILAVNCNRALSGARSGGSGAPTGAQEGVVAYGGQQRAAVTSVGADQVLFSDWPASVLKGSRGIRLDTLPGSVGVGMFEILLPPSLPYAGFPGDILTDDLGQVYTVQLIEVTQFGFRIEAQAESA